MLNLRPSAFEMEARGDRSIAEGNVVAAAPRESIESIFMMLKWDFGFGECTAITV